MTSSEDRFKLRLATRDADLLGAQRLRYRVFVEELGGDGPLVDHANRYERDKFDPFFDHLVLIDTTRSEAELDHVVGVYRLLPQDRLAETGQFYSADEYDLSPLIASERKLLELGRSCVHEEYRGGAALYQLWTGLAGYVEERGIEVMFGVASFHGTDADALSQPLSFLHHNHLAPEDLRVTAKPPHGISMDLLPADQIDRLTAVRDIPALIKSYLRLGGYVGQGAWVDAPFNTTDICLVMDIARISAANRALYAGGRA